MTDTFLIIHSLILYEHRDYKDKISSNNNLAKSKIWWCYSKYEKRKYRTYLGFFNSVLSIIINQGNIWEKKPNVMTPIFFIYGNLYK